MATESRAEAWGTLEELLLACAVNRHGTKSWDSIATEVQNRTSIFHSLTSQHCIDKFNDLKSRFPPLNGASAGFVAVIDDLRKVRVEELRREVQRHDVSISSLESKVKRLEEERGRTAKEETDPVRKLAVGEDPGEEQENRSFSESNSGDKTAVLQNYAVDGEPDPQIKSGNEPDLSGSNGEREIDRKESRVDFIRAGGLAESNELGEKPNSDVQSSASLSLKGKKRRRIGNGGDSGGAEEPGCGGGDSPATEREKAAVESEVMIELIGAIRSHRLGSVFRQRLRSQESQRYKNLIRQHIDLQTIQSSLSKGAYSSSIQKFYRDLLLLFNNGIVFFKKNSPENLAACELRARVMREMAKNLGKNKLQTMKQDEAKQKSTSFSNPSKCYSTIVVCSEAKGNSGGKKDKEFEENPEKIETFSRKVEENNSIRRKRTIDERLDTSKHKFDDVLEMKRVERKEDNNTSKRRGAAGFLRRMTQNSPSRVSEDEFFEEEGKNSNTNNNITERVTRSSKGKDESGRGKKVTVGRRKESESPTGKRGRDSVSGGKGKKRCRTRS